MLNSLVAGDQTSTTEIDLGGDVYAVEVTGATGTNIVLSFDYVTGAGSSNYIYQIEVDGEILVDKANFGTNGFYLPFDPSSNLV